MRLNIDKIEEFGVGCFNCGNARRSRLYLRRLRRERKNTNFSQLKNKQTNNGTFLLRVGGGFFGGPCDATEDVDVVDCVDALAGTAESGLY
jgi:hypothetical protein